MENEKKEKKIKINFKNRKTLFFIIVLFLIIVFFSLIFLKNNLFKNDLSVNDKISIQSEEVKISNVNKNEVENIINETEGFINKTEAKVKNLNLPVLPQKSNKPISQQNEYIDNYYNISFKYPSDWIELYQFSTKKTEENVKNIVMVGQPLETNNIDNMRISIEYTPISISAKEYFSQTEERMSKIFPHFKAMNAGEKTVSGREAPARIYEWVSKEETDKSKFPQEWTKTMQYQLYVAGKTKIYIITFTTTEENFNDRIETYQEILKTINLDF